MARHTSAGDRVWTLILGEGVTSRRHLSSSQKKHFLARVRSHAQRANRILGSELVVHEAWPDNRFDSRPLLDLVYVIESVVQKFRPSIVYTHSATDLNIDHRRTTEAVMAAVRPISGSSVVCVHAFEVPSSTEWHFSSPETFRPNVFINIEKHLAQKLDALAAYDSEIRVYPHPRSKEYIRALSQIRGGQSGLPAAEAFSLIYKREV